MTSTPLSKPARRIDSVDGLRALACLAVLIYHCFGHAGEPVWRVHIPVLNINPSLLRPIQFCSYGVSLFLILSGFCVFYSYAAPGRDGDFSTRAFLTRRFWRIAPAYYATVILGLIRFPIFHWLSNHTSIHFPTDGEFPTVASLSLHVILMHTLTFPAAFDIFGVFWSLGLEWQFYLMFPFMRWSFWRNGPWLTIAMLLVITLIYRAVLTAILKDKDSMVRWTFISGNVPGRAVDFGLGMLAAWQFRRDQLQRWSGMRTVGYTFLFSIFLGLGVRIWPFTVFHDLMWAMACYHLLCAAIAGVGGLRHILSLPALRWIGERSYSVYLLHYFVLLLVYPIVVRWAHGIALFVWLVVMVTPLSLVAASFWYRLFEKPYFNRASSTTAKSSTAKPTVTSEKIRGAV